MYDNVLECGEKKDGGYINEQLLIGMKFDIQTCFILTYSIGPFTIKCLTEEVRHACTNHYKFSAFGLDVIT